MLRVEWLVIGVIWKWLDDCGSVTGGVSECSFTIMSGLTTESVCSMEHARSSSNRSVKLNSDLSLLHDVPPLSLKIFKLIRRDSSTPDVNEHFERPSSLYVPRGYSKSFTFCPKILRIL